MVLMLHRIRPDIHCAKWFYKAVVVATTSVARRGSDSLKTSKDSVSVFSHITLLEAKRLPVFPYLIL